jgi:hypothetical protein
MAYRGSVCLILFHKPGFGLDDAFRALSICSDLCVTRKTDGLAQLAVQRCGGPILTISFQAGPVTQRWVAPLGKRTRHAVALGHCDACFFITLDDLSAALKDIRGLLLVQKTLSEATQGFLYTLWNDELCSVAELAA